ncbi:MAG: EthD family reductase [Anaerolineae bacterium]|nr:EthD family reductase [Anaerolineae bacterium]
MIKVIALLKRRPGMSMEEFKRIWIEEHVQLSAQMPGLRGYRVNIALPTQQDDVPAPDYDGTAELWWDSREEMDASFKTEIAKTAGLDADRFSSVRQHLLTEEFVVVSGPASSPKPIVR